MQKLTGGKKFAAAVLWALTIVVTTAALMWYILDDSPHETVMGPPDEAAVVSDIAGLDLNAATAGQLEELPGIGPVLAERIVTWRAENGPFTGRDDLLAVSGVGPAVYEGIEPYIAY